MHAVCFKPRHAVFVDDVRGKKSLTRGDGPGTMSSIRTSRGQDLFPGGRDCFSRGILRARWWWIVSRLPLERRVVSRRTGEAGMLVTPPWPIYRDHRASSWSTSSSLFYPTDAVLGPLVWSTCITLCSDQNVLSSVVILYRTVGARCLSRQWGG